MNNYAESKKTLDRIRNEYGCQGEIIFRTAIQYIVECGQQTFKDNEWVSEQLDKINAKHDEADRQGKILFISRDFEIAPLECAAKIAKVDAYDFLTYVQKEIWLGHNGVDYQRAVELLKRCMAHIEESHDEQAITLEDFEYIGFTDDELTEFGYDYLFDLREEE